MRISGRALGWLGASLIAAAAAAPASADIALTYDGALGIGPNVSSVTHMFGGGFNGTATAGAWNADGWDGTIWRNQTTGLTTFSVAGMPSHTHVQLDFLIGFLDSWDSTNGSPAPDYLFITIDGVQVAALTSNNASGSVNDFGGGTLLYSGVQIDGNMSYTDKLVDMSTASWASFAHTAANLTIGFQAGGNGWQGGTDEAWGIDALTISYTPSVTPGVPEPASWAMMIGGFGVAGALMRRRRTAVRFA